MRSLRVLAGLWILATPSVVAQARPALRPTVIVSLRSQADTLPILGVIRHFNGEAVATQLQLVIARFALDSVLRAVDSLAQRPEVATDSTCTGPLSTCIEWDQLTGGGTLGVSSERLSPIPGSRASVSALPWGLTALRADSAWAHGDSGQGAMIVDLDSGADSLHVEFAGRLGGGLNAVAVFGGDPTAWGDHNANCRGHGTHTLGTSGGATVGVAPAATLYVVQVFPASGDCLSSTSSAITGLNRAVSLRATAVNISIGYGASASLTNAIRAAKAAGIAVCVANGNSGATAPNPPAQDTAAFGVASYGGGSSLSYFSQRGPTTDWVLPGEGVYSSVPGGYGSKSGTSMATPHCTGAFAVVMPHLASVPAPRRVDSAMAVLTFTGDSFPDPTAYTARLIRLDRAVAFLEGRWPTSTAGPQVFLNSDTRCYPVSSPTAWTATVEPAVPGVTLTQSATQVCVTVNLAAAPAGTTQAVVALKARS